MPVQRDINRAPARAIQKELQRQEDEQNMMMPRMMSSPAKGERGEPGPQGNPGPAGPQGPEGERGAAGAAGVAGQTGAAGGVGPKGDTGPAGPAGPTGATGPKGDTGSTGAQGPKGDVGPLGATGPSPKVPLGTLTVAQTATLVAITAGVRTLTFTGVSGALAGDDLLLFPTAALPAGYAIHNVRCPAAGTVEVTMTAPLLAIGASFSIPCRLVALR